MYDLVKEAAAQVSKEGAKPAGTGEIGFGSNRAMQDLALQVSDGMGMAGALDWWTGTGCESQSSTTGPMWDLHGTREQPNPRGHQDTLDLAGRPRGATEIQWGRAVRLVVPQGYTRAGEFGARPSFHPIDFVGRLFDRLRHE